MRKLLLASAAAILPSMAFAQIPAISMPMNPPALTLSETAPITDVQGNTWTVSNGVVFENGKPASYSARVINLVNVGGAIWQENADHLWWKWSGHDWSTVYGSTVDPTAVTAGAPATVTQASSPCVTGEKFGIIQNATIHDSKGQVFVPVGVNVMQGEEPSVGELQSLMPKITIVRYAVFQYNTAASIAPFITSLTNQGIVVIVDLHRNNANNGNAGGGQGTIFQGSELAQEQAFVDNVGRTFKDNPRVWLSTSNEPPTYDLNGLAQWQLTTVNTFRKAGNDNPVLLQAPGYDASTINVGLPQSVYSQMYNTIWDMHFYAGNSKRSTDQSVVTAAFEDQIAATHRITSAGGVIMPTFIGETGNSQDAHTFDKNWPQTYKAVTQNRLGVGYAAWAWDRGAPGDGLLGPSGLSDYGMQIKNAIAAAPMLPQTTASAACSPGSTVVAAAFPADLTTQAPKTDQTPAEITTLQAITADANNQKAAVDAMMANTMADVQALQTADTSPSLQPVGASQ